MTKSLLDRLFYKTVVGKITEKEYSYRGLVHLPVTMYTVVTEKGKEVLAAMDGHHYAPGIDDLVELEIERGETLVRGNETVTETGQDGRVKVYTSTKCWAPIGSYRILLQPEESPEGTDLQDQNNPLNIY
jgi:hypothetical protein